MVVQKGPVRLGVGMDGASVDTEPPCRTRRRSCREYAQRPDDLHDKYWDDMHLYRSGGHAVYIHHKRMRRTR